MNDPLLSLKILSAFIIWVCCVSSRPRKPTLYTACFVTVKLEHLRVCHISNCYDMVFKTGPWLNCLFQRTTIATIAQSNSIQIVMSWKSTEVSLRFRLVYCRPTIPSQRIGFHRYNLLQITSCVISYFHLLTDTIYLSDTVPKDNITMWLSTATKNRQ